MDRTGQYRLYHPILQPLMCRTMWLYYYVRWKSGTALFRCQWSNRIDMDIGTTFMYRYDIANVQYK